MASISATKGAVTAAGEHRETFGGEFLGDLRADKITGADDRDSRIALLHDVLSAICRRR
jgi:hypothetical protein